jgi:hypothetical protein
MTKTIAEFVLPMALIQEGHYEVPSGGKIVKIDVSYIPNRQMMQNITSIIVDGNGTITFSRDRHGIANVSKVIMELPEANDAFIEAGEKSEDYSLKRRCVMVWNRLIEAVRYAYRAYWITPISEQEIIKFNIMSEDDSGQQKKAIIVDLGSSLSYPLQTNDDAVAKPILNNILMKDLLIPYFDSLFLDAINYYETGRFNEAVIIVNVALEGLVISTLDDILVNQEKPEVAALKLEVIKGTKRFHSVMSTHFKKVANVSLKDDLELWRKFCYIRDRRKEAIHPHTRAIKPDEAFNTISYAALIMIWALEAKEHVVGKKSNES